jgi:hypothetical protein
MTNVLILLIDLDAMVQKKSTLVMRAFSADQVVATLGFQNPTDMQQKTRAAGWTRRI